VSFNSAIVWIFCARNLSVGPDGTRASHIYTSCFFRASKYTQQLALFSSHASLITRKSCCLTEGNRDRAMQFGHTMQRAHIQQVEEACLCVQFGVFLAVWEKADNVEQEMPGAAGAEQSVRCKIEGTSSRGTAASERRLERCRECACASRESADTRCMYAPQRRGEQKRERNGEHTEREFRGNTIQAPSLMEKHRQEALVVAAARYGKVARRVRRSFHRVPRQKPQNCRSRR